tara:strand:- start:901 stop:1446 length:546 start_codon:yes stop_codon:yes gene_type:complete
MNRKTLLILLAFTISVYSCKKEINNNNENNNDNQETVTNYILNNSIKHEIAQGEIIAGLYDGGPNYYISIFLHDDNTMFFQDSDDVDAFSGIGTGCFIHILTSDSLENGTFSANEGWVGFNNFNFNNPDDNIYNLDSLPVNFKYLENLQVLFSSSQNGNYQIELTEDDIEIKYNGVLNWVN